MTGLRDVLGGHLERQAHRPPVHLVPSFNDMNTMAGDDTEAMVMAEHAPVERREVVAATRTSNKADKGWPQFDTVDLHKINVSKTVRDKSHIMDVPKGPGRAPSIWDYVLQSEKNTDAVTKATRMDQGVAAIASRETDYKDVLSHYGSE